MFAYVNGEYVPEEQATISIFDRGLMHGDAIFDTTRTFDGKPFRLEDHLTRLSRALKYIELDGEALVPEIREAVGGVIEQSKDEIAAAGDVWVVPLVTRGKMQVMDWAALPQPTVIVMIKPINFAAFAPLYESGVDLTVSLLTRHFAGAVDARVKMTNRLALVRGELKGGRLMGLDGGVATRAWTLIFNDDGTLAEAHGANLAIVVEDRIVRPPRYQALEGISLDTTCRLGEGIGLTIEERPIALYDVINADEVFITSTSFSILPVSAIDGIRLSEKRVVYSKLLRLWTELVDFDFVAQARASTTSVTEDVLVPSGGEALP